jgi:hypothetical protein
LARPIRTLNLPQCTPTGNANELWSRALIVQHAKRPGIWNRAHHLDRMTLRDLVVAYFQYYAIQAYLLLTAVSIGVAIWSPTSLVAGMTAAVFAVFAYPLVWYLLHRYVLHSKWMWKSPLTARTWKRIHYDHHQDPNHLEVLFGALYTTLPAIAVGHHSGRLPDRRRRRRCRLPLRPGF